MVNMILARYCVGEKVTPVSRQQVSRCVWLYSVHLLGCTTLDFFSLVSSLRQNEFGLYQEGRFPSFLEVLRSFE
jgi:hypothetical protein